MKEVENKATAQNPKNKSTAVNKLMLKFHNKKIKQSVQHVKSQIKKQRCQLILYWCLYS